jgi:hypothetical protein
LKRAARLYRYHLFLLLLVTSLFAISPLHRAYLAHDANLTQLGVLGNFAYGAIVLHQPILMDLLPMYLVFSLLSPPVLMAFHRGREGLVFLLGISLWLCAQIVDPHELLIEKTGLDLRSGGFNLLAWQLLWLFGLYAGFVHGIRKTRLFLRAPSVLWLSAAGAVVFLLARHQVLPIGADLQFYLEREDLRVLRVMNILCQFAVFCYFIRRLLVEDGIPFFDLLGRYSLPVFAFHVLIIYLLKPLTWRMDMRLGVFGNAVYCVAVVMSLLLPAIVYRKYEEQNNRAEGLSLFSRLAAMRRACMALLNRPNLHNIRKTLKY